MLVLLFLLYFVRFVSCITRLPRAIKLLLILSNKFKGAIVLMVYLVTIRFFFFLKQTCFMLPIICVGFIVSSVVIVIWCALAFHVTCSFHSRNELNKNMESACIQYFQMSFSGLSFFQTQNSPPINILHSTFPTFGRTYLVYSQNGSQHKRQKIHFSLQSWYRLLCNQTRQHLQQERKVGYLCLVD